MIAFGDGVRIALLNLRAHGPAVGNAIYSSSKGIQVGGGLRKSEVDQFIADGIPVCLNPCNFARNTHLRFSFQIVPNSISMFPTVV